MARNLIILITLCSIVVSAAINETAVRNMRESLNFKSITTPDRISISYIEKKHPNEKAAILFIQGVNESCSKWSETLDVFYKNSFSIYCYDHRGQGRSTHLGENFDIFHVDNFEHYTNDLDTFIESKIRPNNHKKLFLLSHSMGGAVATRYLQRFEEKSPFTAILMSAPMHEIAVWNLPEMLINLTAKSLSFLGLKAGVPFSDKYDPNANMDELFLKHKMTHDFDRYKDAYKHLLSLKENATTRPSFGWTIESIKATVKIREEAHKIKTPILIFQAGNDVLIDSKGQDEVCRKAQNCKIKRYDNAYHEIFNETDEIRDNALATANEFFNKFLSN